MDFADDQYKHVIRIRVRDQVSELVVEKNELIIGRDATADVPVPCDEISRRHLMVRIEADGIVVRDLGSVNGCYLGTLRLEANKEFKLTAPEPEIRLGEIASVVIRPRKGGRVEKADAPPMFIAPARPDPQLVAKAANIETEARSNAERIVGEAVQAAEEQKAAIARTIELSRAELERLKEMVGRVNYDHQATMQTLAKLNQDVGVIQARRVADEAAVASAKIDLEQLKAAKNDVETELGQLQKSVIETRQILEEITAKSKEIVRLREDLNRVNAEHGLASQSLAALHEELMIGRKTVAEDRARGDEALHRMRLETQEVEREKHKIAGQLDEQRRQLDASKSELADTLKRRSDAERDLAQNRARFTDEVSRGESEVKRLKADLDRVTIDHRRDSQALATLQGELEALGARQRMAVAETNEAVAKAQTEIKRIAAEQTNADRRLSEATGAADSLEKKKVELDSALTKGQKTLAETEQGLTLARKELQTVTENITRLRKEAEEAETVGARKRTTLAETNEAVEKAQAELKRVAAEQTNADRRLSEATGAADSLDKKKAELDSALATGRKAQAETEQGLALARKELQTFTENIAHLRKEAEEAETLRKRAVGEMQDCAERAKRELAIEEAEGRKRAARDSALEAEFKERSLKNEATLRESDLKRLDVEKQLRLTEEKNHEVLTKVATAEARTQELEKRSVAAKDLIERSEEFSRALLAEVSTLEEKVRGSRAEIVAEEERLAKAQAVSADAKKAIEAEYEVLRAKKSTELEAESRAQREALTMELAERGKKMELDLAESHHKELERLKKIEAEEYRSLKSRTGYLVDDIATYVMDLGRKGSVNFPESEIRSVVTAIMEGKSAAGLNAAAVDRTRRFWRKIALIAATPLTLGLLFAFFPSLPSNVWRGIMASVKSGKSDSDVFLAQIKEKGAKWQPPMDRNYRGNFADNVLYVEGYAEMKLDDTEQRKWTLDLNDFLTGRLGLSDRVVVDFIGAETVLVKELIKTRENIVPQFKDLGLSKLAEVEKQEGQRMLLILESDENYAKFRSFEKAYFDDYLSRKRGLASSSPATATPPAPARAPAESAPGEAPAQTPTLEPVTAPSSQ